MTRTIITLEEADKRWLDRYSLRHKQSTAETIRQAIKEYQKKARDESYQATLKAVAGIWKDDPEDSVEYIRKLRSEWD